MLCMYTEMMVNKTNLERQKGSRDMKENVKSKLWEHYGEVPNLRKRGDPGQ